MRIITLVLSDDGTVTPMEGVGPPVTVPGEGWAGAEVALRDSAMAAQAQCPGHVTEPLGHCWCKFGAWLSARAQEVEWLRTQHPPAGP